MYVSLRFCETGPEHDGSVVTRLVLLPAWRNRDSCNCSRLIPAHLDSYRRVWSDPGPSRHPFLCPFTICKLVSAQRESRTDYILLYFLDPFKLVKTWEQYSVSLNLLYNNINLCWSSLASQTRPRPSLCTLCRGWCYKKYSSISWARKHDLRFFLIWMHPIIAIRS